MPRINSDTGGEHYRRNHALLGSSPTRPARRPTSRPSSRIVAAISCQFRAICGRPSLQKYRAINSVMVSASEPYFSIMTAAEKRIPLGVIAASRQGLGGLQHASELMGGSTRHWKKRAGRTAPIGCAAHTGEEIHAAQKNYHRLIFDSQPRVGFVLRSRRETPRVTHLASARRSSIPVLRSAAKSPQCRRSQTRACS
jgi:hypothetical protein